MTQFSSPEMPIVEAEAVNPTSRGRLLPLRTIRELMVGPMLGLSLLLLPFGVPAQVTPADDVDVRVVEHDYPPAGGAVWTVSPEPLLRIGSYESPQHERFSSVPHVLQRTDGALVILDGRTSQLRTFSASGQHLWTAGGRGEAPGRFQWGIESICLMPGDSVIAVGLGGRPRRCRRAEAVPSTPVLNLAYHG